MSSAPPSQPPDPPTRGPTPDRMATFVSHAIKLGGLVVVLNEVFTQQNLRPAALGIAALMFAGAEGLSQFLRSFFGDSNR